MIAFFQRKLDKIRGSGDAAVTVPSMDGALRPNQLVEEAEPICRTEQPDMICECGGEILFSTGNQVCALSDGRERYAFDTTVSALAAGSDGALAVGLANDGIRLIGGPHDGKDLAAMLGRTLNCPVALLFDGADTLFVANGSENFSPNDWKHDLMSRGQTGSVWRIDLAAGSAERLMGDLAWPFGLGLGADGLVITESWRHRVLHRTRDGGVKTPLWDLPGYPARISPASGGGWWLAVFAPRNPLIEFILREPGFRERMIEEIDPDYWAAPSLEASTTFLQPLQGGAQVHLGVVKPWAPSQSYGLVIRLDEMFRPVASQHSRADGKRHGITSVAEVDGQLLAASKGGNLVLRLMQDRGVVQT
ncbi:hypothetical protein SAMN04490248_1268 [Salinihabitans flavidus]|uniref:Strictosidine synthase n=1 Tax=Salinihabitans flavidus TaxID=569882 RepID=A0A1H8V922_9RHOB|nr:hypothetical protein [Salinihabitans flavidus]SEP11308.1 hypothetical protein SAMN04490248_1268 [Salinihabitans flavidus]